MGQPRVSILMPVRNEGPYLRAALGSLFRQTLQEWELVVVDDGSDDATPLILAEAAGRDPRVRVLRRERGGLVAALNAGLASCRAPLVARMDGDDISHPRRLELQAAHLDAHQGVGMVACAFRHFPRTGLKRGMLAYEAWQNGLGEHDLILRDLLVESPFVHPSVMIRRGVLDRLGGYRNCGWPEDYDLWLRMAASGVVFARLPQQLLFWRDHPGRATRTMSAYAAGAFRACKFHFLRQGFLEGVSEVVVAGAGQEGRAWQRLLAADGIRVSCWLDVDPRKLGKNLHGSPVIRLEEHTRARGKILVAIGLRGVREVFRFSALSQGLHEGLDFICVS